MQARHLQFLGVALAFVSDLVCTGIIAMEIGDLSGFLINCHHKLYCQCTMMLMHLTAFALAFGIIQGLCLLGYSMSEPEFEARYLFFQAYTGF
ncbi:hypothetical protein C8F04DRAFT_1063702 [Mycena alexandri]|uniref:Uncharacterized protein n=1 Tax=Mycena alexandri TaxID=1745969 RepID=A0AAD6TJQ4_9AGAR|nr:hypothetical protein C8F04DRAFT_1063702 [Mycena alexandri]